MSDSFAQILIVLQRILLPVLSIVGISGNALNIAVLTRRTLSKHPCSRYFFALACSNIYCSTVVITQNLLVRGYQINLINETIVLCKLYSFTSTLGTFLSPYFIVLASLDRCCASSSNAQVRKFTSVRMAHRMICLVIGFFALLFIHILILARLNPELGFACSVATTVTYFQVYLIIQVFLFAVVPPMLMLILGLLTIKNSTHSRIAPITASRYNRTENQLARMLFFQVAVQIMLTMPTSVVYLLNTLPNSVRSATIFPFVSTISSCLFNCSFVMPFFSYILSGRVYRDELLRLLRTMCLRSSSKRGDNAVVTVGSQVPTPAFEH